MKNDQSKLVKYPPCDHIQILSLFTGFGYDTTTSRILIHALYQDKNIIINVLNPIAYSFFTAQKPIPGLIETDCSNTKSSLILIRDNEYSEIVFQEDFQTGNKSLYQHFCLTQIDGNDFHVLAESFSITEDVNGYSTADWYISQLEILKP